MRVGYRKRKRFSFIKFLFLVILISAILSFVYNIQINNNTMSNKKEIKKETFREIKQSEITNICELATIKCYYHNVAKYNEDNVEGFLFWKKGMNFWIDYTGIVVYGVDLSKLKVKIDGNKLYISMPSASVLSCKVDSDTLKETNVYIAPDSVEPDSNVEQSAFKQTNDKMEEKAKNDGQMIKMATDRAKELIENYVKNINNLNNRYGEEKNDYTIVWVDDEK